MSQALGNLVKLALLCGGAYLAYNWYSDTSGTNEVAEFAKGACLDATKRRMDVSSARVYDVIESNRGFVVRITATLTRGKPVKVACVTNMHGGVTDLDIDER
jgi:hypothetical protein